MKGYQLQLSHSDARIGSKKCRMSFSVSWADENKSGGNAAAAEGSIRLMLNYLNEVLEKTKSPFYDNRDRNHEYWEHNVVIAAMGSYRGCFDLSDHFERWIIRDAEPVVDFEHFYSYIKHIAKVLIENKRKDASGEIPIPPTIDEYLESQSTTWKLFGASSIIIAGLCIFVGPAAGLFPLIVNGFFSAGLGGAAIAFKEDLSQVRKRIVQYDQEEWSFDKASRANFSPS